MVETDNNLPPVLDACCGSRGFWFDKQDERALFVDVRHEEIRIADRTRRDGTKWQGWTVKVSPDRLADFTNLPFPSNSFALVVFDPPHRTRLTSDCAMAAQYGVLFGDWRFRGRRPLGKLAITRLSPG